MAVVYRILAAFPGYRIGDNGCLQSCIRWRGCGQGRVPVHYLSSTWRNLKPALDRRGRRRYTLRRDNKSYRFRAARLVLHAFVGPCPAEMECCHENGDETDDRLENLRWDTHAANLQDRCRHGTVPNGRMIHTAKLTEEAVRVIRVRHARGERVKDLAADYQVSAAMVSLITKKRAWRHVQ